MDSLELAVVPSPFSNLAPLYEVDPDADVLLIVPPHNEPFAPWDESRASKVKGTNGVNGLINVDGLNGVKHNSASRTGLRIKVSSKHLALASRAFKTKLQFTNSQASRQSDGRIHLKLSPGFDPTAVSIVLNAIHGRGSQVPKSVDLDTLAQIALFVDRFQLLDVIEVYADRWISKLEHTLPDTYSRALILWIYIAHTFRQTDLFKTATKTAAAQTPSPLPTLGLPIRDKIIKTIDRTRQTLLTTALTTLHQTLDSLASDDTVAPCATHQCDALVLGELVKALHRHRLAWSRPAPPFQGISFASVVEAVSGGLEGQRRRREGEGEQKLGASAFGVGVGLWSDNVSKGRVNGVNGNGVNGSGGPNWIASSVGVGGARPAWGVVGGAWPVTPAASPEPVGRRGSGGLEGHECDAGRAVAGLEKLGRLGDGIEGLELEGKLGFRLY